MELCDVGTLRRPLIHIFNSRLVELKYFQPDLRLLGRSKLFRKACSVAYGSCGLELRYYLGIPYGTSKVAR